MAEVGTAFVSIVPSARGFGAKLNSEVGTASTAAGTSGGKRFGGTFSSAAGAAVKGLVGVFAVGAVVKGLQSVIAEAREAQKVGAATAQIIKQTGGAANVSAGQVGRLATAISNKTGVDDEAIQKGANLILTFKNVRNEVGKGSRIFDRATKAANDLASLPGMGGIEASAKTLGKALNDPIKGLSALGRAGVTFSESQKKQIQGMVESGNILGAQKIIMAEVESQVGGLAAAQTTAGEKMAVAWNNAKEQIGTALLPTLDRIATFIASKVIPGILKLGPVFSKIGAFVKPAADAIRNLFSGGGGAGGAQLAKTFQAIVAFAKPLLAILMNLGRQAIAILKPAFAEISNIFITQFLPAFRALLPILAPVAAFLLKIFGGAILGIIRGFVAVVKGALLIITGIFQVFAALVKGDWSALWQGLGNILRGAWNVIKGIFQIAINVGIVGVIKKLPAIVWGLFKLLMRGAWAILKGGWNLISSLFRGALSKLGSAVGTGLAKVGQFFRELPGKILGFLRSLPGKLVSVGRDIVNGLVRGIRAAPGKIKDAILSLLPGPLRKLAKQIGIASPSKLTQQWGEWLVEGLVVGIDKRKPAVAPAVSSIGAAALGAGPVGIGSRFSASNLATAGGAGIPDMPIVDGSQIIAYFRDIATARARIEVSRNNQDVAMATRFAR